MMLQQIEWSLYEELQKENKALKDRIRELEEQAETDAKVIEAARAYRIAQQAIASACSPPFDPGVCTDAMVAQDEAEATLDAALAEREEAKDGLCDGRLDRV